MKTTSRKLEKAGFEQARPDDKLFGKKKVFMVFIGKCTFSQTVSALLNLIMTFNQYKKHL
jgi:hypothetical protein